MENSDEPWVHRVRWRSRSAGVENSDEGPRPPCAPRIVDLDAPGVEIGVENSDEILVHWEQWNVSCGAE